MTDPRDPERREDEPPEDRPEFGPTGYLPERAARRARKIVLRAPLGIQWVIASIVAGIVVLAAGIVFLVAGDDPPGDPYVAVGPVEQLGDLEPLPSLQATALTEGGRVRVFADTAGLDLRLCAGANRLGGADGRVWTLTGRGFGDSDSLAEHPAVVHDGILYVDPSRTIPGPRPDATATDPTCPR